MRRGVVFLALLLVAVALIGFQTGAYYYFQRLFTPNSSPANSSGNHNNSTSGNRSNSTSNAAYIEVNTIFNYGNSTITWFNHTRVPAGWNFYNLTLQLTNGRVHSSYFGGDLNEHQILGINGVEQNPSYYWSLWKFCSSTNAWAWSPVGVDRIQLSSGGVYGWYYQSQNGNPMAPVPGAKVIVVLDINSC